jgi:DNA-directed RNA polymerase subunit RPC12/RpoP
MSIEAMKQALEALENVKQYDQKNLYGLDDEITTLRTAIEQAETAQGQEPVGEAYLCNKCQTPFDGAWECPSCGHRSATKEPVYTTPPAAQRQWVGLTEEEHTQIAVDAGCMSSDWVFYGAAVERALKKKNT